jgi:hypothetical protein
MLLPWDAEWLTTTIQTPDALQSNMAGMIVATPIKFS